MKKIISLVMALVLVFGLATISAGAAEETPINENNSYYDAVQHAVGSGYIDSTEATIEKLSAALTRGEFVIMMAKMEGVDLTQDVTGVVTNKDDLVFGVDKCTDLVPGDELYNAAAWAFKNGIINGYQDGTYRPERSISREEVAAIVYRYVMESGLDGANQIKASLTETDNLYFYYDADALRDWAVPAVEWCLAHGIFKGDANGYFGAHMRDINLAQMCAVVYRTEENEVAQENTTKFYLAVESGDGYVSARVNSNYIMKVEVSAEKLAPATVKLIAEMNNVASLGVNSSKKHEVTINTGLSTELDPSLKDWMVNTFNFKGAAINVDIAGKTCVYNVGEVEYNEVTNVASIMFVPANVADTRAAWQELTSHVTTSTQATDDSFIVIGRGSELQLGTEKIVLEGNAAVEGLKLDNFNSIVTLKQTIRDGVALESGYDAAIVAKLGKNTALAVGQTIATLNKTATIEITNVPTASVEGILGDLRDATSTYAMAELLVKAIDGVVGAIDEGETVGINIDFE